MTRNPGESHEDFIHRVAQMLGEYYHCVQIFVHTETDEGGIEGYSSGVGNLWAREYQAEKWLSESSEEISLDDDEDDS